MACETACSGLLLEPFWLGALSALGGVFLVSFPEFGVQMIFSSKALQSWQRTAAGMVALGAVALIGACGGGTAQYEPFVAQRVFAFGDDTTAITSDGKNYGVNGVNSTTSAIDCTLQPVWVQSVASLYGFVFAECNTATPADPNPKAFMRAAMGAKVADVAAQVNTQISSGGFRDKDLALVAAGSNDIYELYSQYPARSEASLIADARTRGENLAAVVNQLVEQGSKVIVTNLHDLGLSPYARAEATANAASGFDRAALITRLTTAFNERLGVKVLLDGRFVGLAQMDLRTQAAGRVPGSVGLVDASTAFCSVAPPNCTTLTAATASSSASQYLWADDKRLAPGGQVLIASLALARAQGNPF